MRFMTKLFRNESVVDIKHYFRKKTYENVRFLAIDFEFTGMDPNVDQIVSVGWVPIHNLGIELDKAYSAVVSTDASVGDSATIHGIHDDQLLKGRSLEEVITKLIHEYKDHVLVAHHAQLDVRFLSKAIERCCSERHAFKFVDTMLIEKRRLQKKGIVIRHDSLILKNCLERHGLPVGKQHQSLADAFSCAQLFICQLTKYQGEYIDL